MKQQLTTLLEDVKPIIDRQIEREKKEGGQFNIFSILEVERKENGTHSAFIGELLNVNGLHFRGNTFLLSLLETLEINERDFHYPSANATTEKYIGLRDDVLKTGGRIDIYIWDKYGRCISIENKIDAGDQQAQVERYCAHKKGKNKVFYLTLDGRAASPYSAGDLKAAEDYFTISYKKEIIDWLNKCLQAVDDCPPLTEAIRQYLTLIKNITLTMENNEQKDLIETLLKNFEAAAFVKSNFKLAKQTAGEEIRKKVFDTLNHILPQEQYEVYQGNNAFDFYSQIWIKLKSNPTAQLYFGVESFSGEGNKDGRLYIGVFNDADGKYSEFASLNDNTSMSAYWINVENIDDYNGLPASINNPATVSRLHNDASFQNGFVAHIATQVKEYIALQYDKLHKFLNIKKDA